METVSWNECQYFCRRLSERTGKRYRLPSEAEWEYACRAGTTMPFHCGETITTDLANYNGNETYAEEEKGGFREKTLEVGSFLPNAWGLYDMHGNVWELCEDGRHENYQRAPMDGSAWTEKYTHKRLRVLRGCSWYGNPESCRSAIRLYCLRDSVSNSILGLRLVSE